MSVLCQAWRGLNFEFDISAEIDYPSAKFSEGAFMKSKNAFVQIACVAVFSTVSLFSCQPKDVSLKATADAFKASKSGSETAPTNMNSNETNAVLALSFDRMAESVFLIKAVLNSEFATSQFLLKSQVENTIDSDELPDTYLESVNQNDQINTNVINYVVDEISVDVSGKLRKLVLTKNTFKPAVSKGINTKKSDFTIKNTSDRITVKLTSNDEIYLIKINRTDETSSKVDKNTTLKFEAKFKLAWSGQIADLDKELQISNISFKADRDGNKKGKMNFVNDQQNISVTVGKCVSLNGRLNLNADLSKPGEKLTNPTEIVLTDSTMDIGKFKSAALPCENRPVVDLTRMLFK